MKHGWVVLLLLAGVIAPQAAKAQAAAYGEFSVGDYTNLVRTDLLYGGTVGVLVGDLELGKHIVVQGDVQGRFVRKSGMSFNGLTVGPRFEFPLKRAALTPYAELMVGFGRLHEDSGVYAGSTTDSTLQVNGGVARRLTPRWDAVLDYSYAQYYAYGGQYNPKTFGIGVVYHFVKR
ncbi:MAG: outer membrane beta-barrel protein [Acidobacteriota bacterium]